ncbi:MULTISPECIES: DUF4870 domain-containing protein [Anaerolinea]|uniref:DUF4870 domain-containing protein n=1 Tax=Anaerolinea TaxID=233189 RepID=UPI002636C1E1|nr:DUF4870 domain-containing protein [Anaerolinea thermophila]
MSDQFEPMTDVTSDDKLWTLLAYIFTPIIPIVILLLEDKKNRPFIKRHNMQALILGVVEWVINFLLSFVVIGCVTSVLTLILNIYLGIKANRGETFDIPVISNFVRQQGW